MYTECCHLGLPTSTYCLLSGYQTVNANFRVVPTELEGVGVGTDIRQPLGERQDYSQRWMLGRQCWSRPATGLRASPRRSGVNRSLTTDNS